MESNDRSHVVRLSDRGNTNSERFSTRIISRPTSSRAAILLDRKERTINTSEVRVKQIAASINASSRVSVNSNHSKHASSAEVFSFASGWVSKFAALALVPMLLIYPLVPVYAADEAASEVANSGENTSVITGTPSEPIAAEVPNNDMPSLSDVLSNTDPDVGQNTEETTEAFESETDDSQLASVEEGGIQEASNDISEEVVKENATLDDTSDTSSAEQDTVSGETGSTRDTQAEESPIVDGGTSETDLQNEENTSTETLSDGGENSEQVDTTQDPAPSEEILNEDEITNEEAVQEAAVPEVVETPEEIASRLVAEKEGILRNQLRKEIESEFTKGCVTMDTVGYYCLKDSGVMVGGSIAPSSLVTAVEAALGADGSYKQIFMTKGGDTISITSDTWDNAFPTIDVAGKSIVWQGNVGGRWQIFFADASGTGTPKITQVTHSSESNFNPRVDGDQIVWQGWVDGNWEVYFAEPLPPEMYPPEDAELPLENERLGVDRTWHVERITDNDEHDMFPSISGGLITWQSFQDGNWNVFIYGLKTKTIAKISRDGVKSENPRFAITWDERSENGSVRMMGYDIATGKVVDITSDAQQVGDEKEPYKPATSIPQPAPTALPSATSTATSTTARGDDGGDGGVDNGLDV